VNIPRLIRRNIRERQPLRKHRVENSRALRLLLVPRVIPTGEGELLAQLGLDRGIHRDAEQVVERAAVTGGSGSDDVVGPGDGVGGAAGWGALAEGGEEVLLLVVEVPVTGADDARVGFEGGNGGWAEVEGVMLGAGLQDEAAWVEVGELQGGQEVGE
jgi:hypothetical protein